MTSSDWDKKAIKEWLDTQVVERTFEVFEELDSTNRYALHRAAEGAEDGTLILADRQSHGRGRMGREWVSPGGVGIYATVILRPQCNISDLPKFTFLAGVAVAEAVREVTDLPATIKWPNDVLIEGKKFCGTLEESFISGSVIRYLVMGIGINVNTDPTDLPVTSHNPPTSLKAEKGSPVDRLQLLVALLEKLDSGYADIREGRGNDILHRWRGLSATLGRKVRVKMSNHSLEGQAVDIDDDGGLLISVEGKIQKITSGDIMFLDY